LTSPKEAGNAQAFALGFSKRDRGIAAHQHPFVYVLQYQVAAFMGYSAAFGNRHPIYVEAKAPSHDATAKESNMAMISRLFQRVFHVSCSKGQSATRKDKGVSPC
jgi:hypothetical protein